MRILEIIQESVTPIWGRKGGRITRRYRCTAGIRKGRIVGSPATCTKPKNIKRSLAFRLTRARKGAQISIRSAKTKRATGSRRVARLNRPSQSKSSRPNKRKPIRK